MPPTASTTHFLPRAAGARSLMMVGSRSLSDYRHVAIILLAVVVAAAGMFSILRTGGAGSTEAQRGAAAVFGLGRGTVHVTPGTAVSGSLQLPAMATEDEVTWRISGGRGADAVRERGTGVSFEFVAPASGLVTLEAGVEVGGKPVTTKVVFRVDEPSEFVGTEVKVTGNVRVDGGLAVTGEALKEGTVVDATYGSLSYLARASVDGQATGRLTMKGGRFKASASTAGTNRVVNTIEVPRPPDGEKHTLSVDAEPTKGQRYVSVRSPDAVAMVKGTRFDVSIGPDGTGVNVEHGIVEVWDRFRYYVDSAELHAEDGVHVDAVDVAVAAELTAQAMRAGGSSIGRVVTSGFDTPIAPLREQHGTVLESIMQERVEEVPELPLKLPAKRPSSTGPGDGLVSDPDGTKTSPTSGDATDPAPLPTAGSETPATGGGDTGTSEPAPPPVKRPPSEKGYVLEHFKDSGYHTCLATHVVWNAPYGVQVPEGHLCYPRELMSQHVDELRGYRPLGGWGCFREHAVWLRDSNGAPTHCYPVAQSTVDNLATYAPPLMKGGSVMPCSTGHRFVDGLCRPG